MGRGERMFAGKLRRVSEDSELPEHIQEALRRAIEVQESPAIDRTIATAVNLSLPPVYAEIAVGLQRVLESWRQQFAYVIAPAIEQWRLHLPKIAVPPHLGETLAGLGETIRDAWRRVMPDNWVELTTDEVLRVIDRVAETGFTLVWLPRVEMVRELLAAEPDSTASVLVAHRDDVLDDAEVCVADVHRPELQLMRLGVEQSINALRESHVWAAQALASSVFTSEAHTLLKYGLKSIRKQMADEHPKDAGISQLRLRTIFLAGAKALEDFDPTGERGAAEFNRHNSAHRITAEQWNDANALSAIMLAAAFLREIEYWYPVLVRDVRDSSA